MSELVMALEALQLAEIFVPEFLAALKALLSLFHTDVTTPSGQARALTTLNQVVGYGVEALKEVQNLKFNNADPVANTLGQWQSALVTVESRVAAAGLVLDPAALQTAMDLASHKVGIDSPLDVSPLIKVAA